MGVAAFVVAAGELEPPAPVVVVPVDPPAEVAVGRPKPVTDPENGPGRADADAPTPTRPPTSCCLYGET